MTKRRGPMQHQPHPQVRGITKEAMQRGYSLAPKCSVVWPRRARDFLNPEHHTSGWLGLAWILRVNEEIGTKQYFLQLVCKTLFASRQEVRVINNNICCMDVSQAIVAVKQYGIRPV
jgi:hypothetical protein